MNINLIKLTGVTRALNRIAEAIERHNELQELALQDIGITTRVVIAKKKDLAETIVEYPDSEFEEAVETIESEYGIPMNDERREILREQLENDRRATVDVSDGEDD